MMKRRGIAIGLAVLMSSSLMAGEISSLEGTSGYGKNEIQIVANNGNAYFDDSDTPIIKDDRVLVPIKYIGDTFGAVTELNAENGNIIMRAKGNLIEFSLDSKEYKVKAQKKVMDTEPFVKNNKIYLPIRYAFEIFGVDVKWDADNYAIIVDEDAMLLANYTNYSYGITKDAKTIRYIKFRSKYDSGLIVKPADAYRGIKGNRLVEFCIDNTKDIEAQLEDIYSILEKEKTENGVESLKKTITDDGTYKYNERKVGDYTLISLNGDGLGIDLARNSKDSTGYGGFKRNGKNYSLLSDKGVIKDKQGHIIDIEVKGKAYKLNIEDKSVIDSGGNTKLLEDGVILLDRQLYLSDDDLSKL